MSELPPSDDIPVKAQGAASTTVHSDNSNKVKNRNSNA